MTIHTTMRIVLAIGSVILMVEGALRLAKRNSRGWAFVAVGLAGIAYIAIRSYREASFGEIVWTIPQLLDHFAAMLAGVVLVLLPFVMIQDIKRMKSRETRSPNTPSDGTR